jgi:carbonic anhydrase
VSVIDELLASNARYVTTHERRELPGRPARHVAVLTCMDARLDLFGALGLELGDAHFVRNAGGLASEDAIRSLLLSQRLLGTRAVMVIHHTRCGLETFEEESMLEEINEALGHRPPFRLGAYKDVDEDVRRTVKTLRTSPFVEDHEIRGFVYDVDDAALREVDVP